MDNRLIDRIGLWIVALGLLLSAGCFILLDVNSGIGASAGSLTAILNWLSVRFIGRYFARAQVRSKGVVMALYTFKMTALFLVCYLLVVRLHLDALGFMIGLGSLVLGITLGGLGSAAPAAERGKS